MTFGARASLQQHGNISLARAIGTDNIQVLAVGSQRLDPEADLLLSVTAGDATVLLPKIRNAVRAKRYWIKRLGAGKFTLVASAGELIDTMSSIEVPAGASFRITPVNLKVAQLWLIASESTPSIAPPAPPPFLTISASVQTTGTETAVVGEMHRYDPNGGGVQVNAPSSPSAGNRFAVKNVSTDMTSATISGNGNNIEEETANSAFAASFGTTTRRFYGHWVYDGTQWLSAAQR